MVQGHEAEIKTDSKTEILLFASIYTILLCSHPCKLLKERLICNAVERVLVLRGQRAIWPGHHLDDIVALPVQAYNLLSKHVFMTYSTVLYLLLHYKFPATQHVHQSASP